jgi:DNA-binding NtrC family response regulator
MNLFARLKEKRLLLIDDDEWIRDSLSLFFELKGCSLMAVETAEEGLKELSRRSYDIIIADYKLPGMNGLEFFKRIASFYRNTIKIFISAYGSAELIAEARRTGVGEFIEKPFTTGSIEASLVRLLQ